MLCPLVRRQETHRGGDVVFGSLNHVVSKTPVSRHIRINESAAESIPLADDIAPSCNVNSIILTLLNVWCLQLERELTMTEPFMEELMAMSLT